MFRALSYTKLKHQPSLTFLWFSMRLSSKGHQQAPGASFPLFTPTLEDGLSRDVSYLHELSVSRTLHPASGVATRNSPRPLPRRVQPGPHPDVHDTRQPPALASLTQHSSSCTAGHSAPCPCSSCPSTVRRFLPPGTRGLSHPQKSCPALSRRHAQNACGAVSEPASDPPTLTTESESNKGLSCSA